MSQLDNQQERFWQQVKTALQQELGSTICATWIEPLKITSLNQEEATLAAPDKFFLEWVQRNYQTAAEKAAQQITQNPAFKIKLILSEEPATPGAPSQTVALSKPTSYPTPLLNPRYTFENFVVGPSNRHAHAYSLAVAEAPGKVYNPLFIYGGVGLGKTHLIQAICHHILRKMPNCKVVFMPSEGFTNELIQAIQHHSTNNFRQKYRNVDVLVIDDVHFFAGRESTQEEFFNTFNALYDSHKQIILASDRPPKEITNLQERLVSRFSWGLTCDIQPPDLETRVAILRKKIEREPVEVPDEVIFFIAQLIKTNIRDLEGALVRVIAYALLEEKAINLDLAKEVLKDLLKESQKLITVEFIQRCVAEEFGISMVDFRSRRRNKNTVLTRQVAMYLSRELTQLSFPEIGEYFGGKDHTTVLHAYNKIKADLEHNPQLKEKIEHLINIIKH